MGLAILRCHAQSVVHNNDISEHAMFLTFWTIEVKITFQFSSLGHRMAAESSKQAAGVPLQQPTWLSPKHCSGVQCGKRKVGQPATHLNHFTPVIYPYEKRGIGSNRPARCWPYCQSLCGQCWGRSLKLRSFQFKTLDVSTQLEPQWSLNQCCCSCNLFCSKDLGTDEIYLLQRWNS